MLVIAVRWSSLPLLVIQRGMAWQKPSGRAVTMDFIAIVMDAAGIMMGELAVALLYLSLSKSSVYVMSQLNVQTPLWVPLF